MERITVTEARKDLSELLNRVRYGGERIGLTRRGKVVAVLVSPTDGQGLEEMEDELDAEAAQEALESIANGEGTITLAQLKAELAALPAAVAVED